MKINEFIKYEECAWNWTLTGVSSNIVMIKLYLRLNKLSWQL